MTANSKLDAFIDVQIQDEEERRLYQKRLKEFWKNDLQRLYHKYPKLFDNDALDELISLFD